MKRFWISFWTGNYADEGCLDAPFQVWLSGQTDRRSHLPQKFESGEPKDDCSLCAVVDANSEEEIFPAVLKYFPDAEMRFCEPRPSDFVPGDRFGGFEGKTALHF
jgi:hypothetical protein